MEQENNGVCKHEKLQCADCGLELRTIREQAGSDALDIVATAMECDVRWADDGVPVTVKWMAYKALCKAVRREARRS